MICRVKLLKQAMASTVVKCSNCNVVINEVLSFICNKIQVMDEQSIASICVSAFSEGDILEAKNLLFESVSTAKRKKIRRREGKTLRNIDDIVGILKNLDPEEIPIFVARDLHKLPPVLFDHVDVTRVLKDILKMRSDIDRFVKEYATVNELKELAAEVESLKKASLVNNFTRNVNVMRGAGLLSSVERDSGPMGFSPICSNNKTVKRLSAESSSTEKQPLLLSNEGSGIKTTSILADGLVSSPHKCEKARVCTSQVAVSHERSATPVATVDVLHMVRPDEQQINNKSFAEVVQSRVAKTQEPTGEWELVQRRRLRNRFLGKAGTATVNANTNFKAAVNKTPIYVYNVSLEASVCDIKAYVNNMTNLDVHVEKMKMKAAKDYNAYIVYVPRTKMEIFLNDGFWPDGVLYRRFVEFNQNKAQRTYRQLATMTSTTNEC